MGKMIPQRLVQCAREGDLQAIAVLMQRHLQPQGIQVSVERRGDCLQVVLESDQVLHQPNLVRFIQRGMEKLAAPGIKLVRVYGQKPEQELPLWVEQIQLIADPETPAVVMPGQAASSQKLDREQLLSQYAAGVREFRGVDLSEADLQEAKLAMANLQQVNFTWANLSRASFSHANLSGAKLNYARLTDANLQGANLQGASLQGADLRGANLSWAQLSGANLTDADLTGANLMEANLLRVIMPDGTLLD